MSLVLFLVCRCVILCLKQCLEVCAYPFAVPGYMGSGGPGHLIPSNGDIGVDDMVSVIGHELAELSSNSLVNT